MNKIIAANWKMNGSLSLAKEILQTEVNNKNQIIILPPAVFIADLKKLFVDSGIKIGAQNCYVGDTGAFTGEISAKIFADFGCEYVLVGHSERRHIFGESNKLIKQKFAAILHHKMIPILCVGETEAQYEAAETFSALKAQLEFLKDFPNSNFVIAYEPVWAIGTGRVPSHAEILRVHQWIKQFLLKECLLDGLTMSIIYGGSVNSSNAESIMSLSDVDGVLVGGASLKPQEFLEIATCIK